jgi:hypothetical protein
MANAKSTVDTVIDTAVNQGTAETLPPNPANEAMDTEINIDFTEPRAESRFKVGDIRTENIRTCVEVIPSTGSNAGKKMYVINGVHWSRHKPKDTDNTIVLEFATWNGGSGWNVRGFNNDARVLSLDAKISKLKEHEADYSMAIATLLR